MTKPAPTLEELKRMAITKVHFITSQHPNAKAYEININKNGRVTARAVYDE